jgi:hypothetical protein
MWSPFAKTIWGTSMRQWMSGLAASAMLCLGLSGQGDAQDVNTLRGDVLMPRAFVANADGCPIAGGEQSRESAALLGQIVTTVLGGGLRWFSGRLAENQSLENRTILIDAHTHFPYYTPVPGEGRLVPNLPACVIFLASDQAARPDSEGLRDFVGDIFERDLSNRGDMGPRIDEAVRVLNAMGVYSEPSFYFEAVPEALVDGIVFNPRALHYAAPISRRGRSGQERLLTLDVTLTALNARGDVRSDYLHIAPAFIFQLQPGTSLGEADLNGVVSDIFPHPPIPSRVGLLASELQYCRAQGYDLFQSRERTRPTGWAMLDTAPSPTLSRLSPDQLRTMCENYARFWDREISGPDAIGQTVTVSFQLEEVRNENGLALAMSGILADRNVRDALVAEAQTSLGTNSDDLALEQADLDSAYQLALIDLSTSQAAYQAAVETGDPVQINTARRDVVRKLAAARRAAIQAGIDPTGLDILDPASQG